MISVCDFDIFLVSFVERSYTSSHSKFDSFEEADGKEEDGKRRSGQSKEEKAEAKIEEKRRRIRRSCFEFDVYSKPAKRTINTALSLYTFIFE